MDSYDKKERLIMTTEVLQELGEWSDYKMVQWYAHFSHEHLQQYVNRNQKNVSTNFPALREIRA